MSTDGSETAGTQGEDVFTRAQWLLDHPEEGERLVGEMLTRQAEALKRQRIADARALFAALCRDAQSAGQLTEQQTVDPTCLVLVGHDNRTRKQIRFTLSFPLEEDERQNPSSDMPVGGA
ncbi:MAG: hypothetical protein PHX87_05385 [Candidatus Peribacteraceae bacterium]|nr:hypothetical protein [Candidatus Peribacteraceae bacterium]MDD5742827.1 hypothetical protein [Candidatus Peribacteraceae bacterium]